MIASIWISVELEPVVARPAVEHQLQCADAEAQCQKAEKVERLATVRPVVRDEEQDAERGNNADRHIDVKHPAPAVIFGKPAPDRRAHDRPEHHAHAPQRHRRAMALRRVDRQQHRLRQRHQRGAANPLPDTIDHELRQAGRAAGQSGAQREADDRDEKDVFDAELPGEPPGQRHHDRRRDHVGGQHPGDLVLRHRQAALHVRQRDIGDRVVDTLHDRRQHDRGGDQGATGAGAALSAPHRRDLDSTVATRPAAPPSASRAERARR